MKPIGPSPVRLRHRNGLKKQKNSKNYEQQITNVRKTQISKAIKIISYYLIFINLYFNFYIH